jgi:hypothetical protein
MEKFVKTERVPIEGKQFAGQAGCMGEIGGKVPGVQGR